MTNQQWDYLSTEILTSAPQKLHLLLLEGALRQIRLTETFWQAGQVEEGYQSLEKARAIVAELLAGVRPERWPEVAPRVAAIYRFVYLTLAQAGLARNIERLREAARVLEIDRETWRQVCQRLQEGPSSQENFSGRTTEHVAPGGEASNIVPAQKATYPSPIKFYVESEAVPSQEGTRGMTAGHPCEGESSHLRFSAEA